MPPGDLRSHLNRRRRPWALGSRGTAAIEFALLLPLLMLFVLASIEWGRAFYIHDIMAKATRDATRYLARTPRLVPGTVDTTTGFGLNAKNLALRGSMDGTQPLLIPNLDGTNTATASVSFTVTKTTDKTTYDGSLNYVTGLLSYPYASPLMTVFGFRGTFTIAISHNERAIGA
jgi:Flp pilus assembly protein TadG